MNHPLPGLKTCALPTELLKIGHVSNNYFVHNEIIYNMYSLLFSWNIVELKDISKEKLEKKEKMESWTWKYSIEALLKKRENTLFSAVFFGQTFVNDMIKSNILQLLVMFVGQVLFINMFYKQYVGAHKCCII